MLGFKKVSFNLVHKNAGIGWCKFLPIAVPDIWLFLYLEKVIFQKKTSHLNEILGMCMVLFFLLSKAFFKAFSPALCGMLEYNATTSGVTKFAPSVPYFLYKIF